MSWRPTVLALICLVATAACGSAGTSGSGGSSGSGTPSSIGARIPPPLDVCPATKTPWRALTGVPVDAAAVGSGPAVIFANDSGNRVCPWLPLAAQLVASGHRVATFTYSNPSATADPANLRALLAVASAAADGAKFVLIGASIGGRLVIEAAASDPAGLAGIVSLSGEATLQDAQDITPLARRVALPAFYVGAREDSYTEGTKQQDALHAAMHGAPNVLLRRPGSAHGTDLLAGADGAVVRPRVIAFVRRLLP